MRRYKKTVYVCVGWVTVSFAMRCQWTVKRSDLGREREEEEREKEGEEGIDRIAEGWCWF